jgi:hypothetical protein
MDKRFQLYLTNTDTGPYKIPFKKGTPKELQAKVNGVIYVGKKAIIPSDVSEFVDMDRVEKEKQRGHVKYKVREVLDIPSSVKPVKKVRKVGRPKIEKKKEKGVN